MISAGLEGRLPYMTYPEPWRGPPKQPPELFLRPAPKPLPTATSRYNGLPTTTTYPNGTRIAPSRPVGKYPSPPSSVIPVNLTQPKEEPDDISPYSPYRMFPHSPQFPPHFPYPSLQPYMMRTNFPPTPLSPQEMFSPGTPTASSSQTFLSPPATFSPPCTIVKPNHATIRDKRTPPMSLQGSHSQQPSIAAQQQQVNFKVPSGKEGSMKHRILTRPEDQIIRNSPLDLQKPPEGRRRLQAAINSPPRSPKKTINNNVLPGNFTKGSLIQLANGDYRRIEEMRTEDFLLSAEKSPDLRLAESTVVKIEENNAGGVTITLTYNERRAQVEVESIQEHPYFVMGHGWASCNPDRTQQCFGLKVHRLQVGDVLISLTPREKTRCYVKNGGSTIMTTATTTSMTARQVSVNSNHTSSEATTQSTNTTRQIQSQPMNLQSQTRPPQSTSPDSLARKRRWSAPDQICEDDEPMSRRNRAE